jgi:hypothetical protein
MRGSHEWGESGNPWRSRASGPSPTVRQWNSTPRASTRIEDGDVSDMNRKLAAATNVTFPEHLLVATAGVPFGGDGGIFDDRS